MNTKKYFNYILFVAGISLLSLMSCRERIDINTSASPPRVVIYGYISTDTTQHEIRITRSTGYFDTTKPEGIPQATVSINSDDNETFPLSESPDDPGLYLTSPDVYGIPGKTYTLHATLDFYGDGKTEEYEATSYLPFPAILDSVAATHISMIDNFLQVLIWGTLPEESNNNFSFHLFRNGVAINDSLKGFQITQDKYIATKKIEALPVFLLNQDRDDEKLLGGDTLTMQVESLTSDYAAFIQNAQSELRGPIPLFGGPPANVETNISCVSSGQSPGISGFFAAYSKSRTTAIYQGD